MATEPIAIIGRGCVLPGCLTPDALWSAVANGDDLTSHSPEGRWGLDPASVIARTGERNLADKAFGDRGGFVRGFDNVFDPTGFAIPQTALAGLDPGFLWLLHAGREAWREAWRTPLNPARTGVIVGNLSYPTRGLADFASAVWRGDTATSTARAENRFSSGYPAHLLANAMAFGGPAFALDAACASSLYALKYACDLLNDGDVDAMVVGAVNACDNIFLHMGFTALSALSRTGASRPFSKHADGLLPAEGAAAVVLIRARDVDPARDRVLGVIRGVGLSNDGKRRGLLAPDADGQGEAIARAYAASGVAPQSVSLIECHATGTPTGDPIEIRGLAAAFAGVDDLPIGSLKSNTGHLITAAGMAGLLKLLGALEHGVRPPTLLQAEDAVDVFDGTQVRPLLSGEPWPETETPRRAGLSAFGFGGDNAHLVLEEWRAPAMSTPSPAPSPVQPSPVEDIVICGVGVSAGDARGVHEVQRRLEATTPDTPSPRRDHIEIDLTRVKSPPMDLAKALAQQTLLFEVVDEALAAVTEPASERIGVFVGMACDPEAARWALRWREAQTAEDKDGVVPPLDAPYVLGAMPNIPANRLNVRHDWRGLGFTVASEELSGLDALRLALGALQRGELDMAVVAASDLSCEPVHTHAARAMFNDPSFTPGDGAAALTLKRRADAERDADIILATVTHDGTTDTHTPNQALTERFGVAHAAASLMDVAVRAAAGAQRRTLDDDGARAWFTTQHSVSIHTRSFSGRSSGVSLNFDNAPTSSLPHAAAPPALIWFAANDMAALAQRVARNEPGGDGPTRLAICTRSDNELAAVLKKAAAALAAGRAPKHPDIAFAAEPVGGETALMFTGAAAAYPAMTRGLFAAFPEACDTVAARFNEADDTARRLARDTTMLRDPFEQLRATTLVSQVHAVIARDILGVEASAALGLSSGETNALLAFGAWSDPDALLDDVRASQMYERWLCGRFETAADAWDLDDGATVAWRNWRLLAPLEAVRTAVADHPRVSITIVHGPRDCVIAGDAEACRRVIDAVGAGGAVELGQDMIVHCAEMNPFAETWRTIHTRHTSRVDGVRFYTNATNAPYLPMRTLTADMLTRQAVEPINFPTTVERAYADGVRVFLEAGPRDTLSIAVADVLKGRPHATVSLDRFGREPLRQVTYAAAALWVAGVPIKLSALAMRLDLLREQAKPVAAAKKPFRIAAHPPAVVWRTQTTETNKKVVASVSDRDETIMKPAPHLAPSTPGQRTAVRTVANGRGVDVMAPAPGSEAVRTAPVKPEPRAMAAAAPAPTIAPSRPAPARPAPATPPAAAARPRPARGSAARAPRPPLVVQPERTPVGPTFDRAALEIAASGKISEIFGPMFARQDGYARQVRMPMPPLLLADRVTGIEGEPGVLGPGTIWTETDIRADTWFMHHGRMPPGLLIESGQADLLLASWMGADFLNQSDRVYRLLGCELTFHDGGMPQPGDTLRFQICIDRYAELGDTRLFFFHYDCRIGDRLLLSVRNGQAGFFTDAELAKSSGILWDAATAGAPTAQPRLTPLPNASAKRAFSRADIGAYLGGDAFTCFGSGFEKTGAQQRTPRPPEGRMRMIDTVETFEPSGGPWGRGYLRATAEAPADAWFYEGHFHNDPCMPGTLMAEAAVQAVELFMAAAGLTSDRDGWRFEPATDEAFTFICRGQVTPEQAHALTYEVFIDEIVDGDEPVVYASLLASSDGFKVFACPRFGVKLVRDWPVYALPEAALISAEPQIVSPKGDVRGDYGALLACAWGRPSDAFGSMYARFDTESSVPRLPGPPYHVVSRIVSVTSNPGEPEENATVIAEYDPPEDAWYFDANGSAVMPFSVLMEVLLQPCGWLASYCGFAVDGGLAFRNLDGDDAVVQREIRPGDGPLRVTTVLTRWSKVGPMTIVFFDVSCTCANEQVMAFTTSFGFFPAEALASQAGLPTKDEQRALLTEKADLKLISPARAKEGRALPPSGDLKMFDVVTGFWPDGGQAGLGRIRGRQTIDPTAWYFRAHFYGDPVQPGSLGVESLLQLLEHALRLKGADKDFIAPRFEAPALGVTMSWKYRGQVSPTNKHVTSTLDILSIERDERGLLVTARASLWVDGMRIYAVEGVSVRIVEGEAESEHTKRFDTASTPWIADHCPTYTLPALPMTARLAEAGEQALRRTGGVYPLVIDQFTAKRWAIVPDTGGDLATRLTARGAGRFNAALIFAGNAVAQGSIRCGGPTPQIEPWSDMGKLSPVQVYDDGGLFHGPAFYAARDVQRGAGGATANIDLGHGFDPNADLDVVLMDALLHPIPHDTPEDWFGSEAAGMIAYPLEVERLCVLGPRPRVGQLRVDVRPLAIAPDGRSVRVAVRAYNGDDVWLDLTLREALMPKGPLGRLSPAERRTFLRDGAYVEAAHLSRSENGETTLSLSEVAASDWLPGTLAFAYGVNGDAKDMARQIAIKEHVSHRWQAHPRRITVSGNEARFGDRQQRVTASFDDRARSWRITDA